MAKHYGELVFNLQDDEWIITELEAHAIIRLKNLFPRIATAARPPFKFPGTLELACDLEWFIQRYPLRMSDDDYNKLKIKKHFYEQRIKSFEDLLSENYVPQPIILTNEHHLREYQAKAVELIHRNKALLLGDDLGLGKTVSGIGLLLKEGTLPAIIVVPTHLMEHWSEKIKEFTNLRVHKIKGRHPYRLPVADVFVIKYSCLDGWIDVFNILNYKTIIFDEVHYLRRRDSNRYLAAEEMTKYATWKLGLSATPIFNYGDEIFNILDVLNKEGLGDRESFLREWTTQGPKPVVKNPKALGTFLRDSFMFLRRTPEDVGRELPVVNRIVQNVDFDQKTVDNAEKLMKELAMKVLHGSFNEKGMASRELDRYARQITGISKARAVAEYVKILLENGRPVLLFGWHREVYSIWEEAFKDYKCAYYTGSETSQEKHANAQLFKEGKIDLLILSLQSGEGLDGLQFRCKDVVFGELDWTPARHEQCIGRANRDGQTEQVTAHFLVSDTGSDPLIIELLGMKSAQARKIVDPGVDIQQVVSDSSRMKLLANKLLNKKTTEE